MKKNENVTNLNNPSGENKLMKLILLAIFVAIGVVISPILRIEGMAPMQHLVNIVCSVFMGPWYSLACAVSIGLIRMSIMAIPPLALSGAVFGAFLSGIFYQWSKGKIYMAVLGEVIGTGIIGSIVSYPLMAYLVGRNGLTWFFYTPFFVGATLIGGGIAYVFLKSLQRSGNLAKLQKTLGGRVYG